MTTAVNSDFHDVKSNFHGAMITVVYQLSTVNLVQPNTTLPPFLITIQHTIHWLVCRRFFSRSMVSLLLPLLDLFLWLGSLRETTKRTCSQASLYKPLVSQQNDPCTYRSTVILWAIRGDLFAQIYGLLPTHPPYLSV